jgi:PAS domain S-box-containing protein
MKDVNIDVDRDTRYLDLYKGAPVPYLSITPDGYVIECNRAAESFFGYSLEELQSMQVMLLYAEESRPKAKELLSRFKQGIPIENEEMVYLRKDGERVYGLLSVNPLKDASGRIIASRSVIVDITRLKEAEEQLVAVKEMWEKSFGAVKEALFIIDSKHKILQCNPAMVALVGEPPENIIGRECYEVVHNSAMPPEGCATCKALDGCEYAHAELYEPHLKRYIEVEANPVYGADGKVSYVVHLIRDITERKKAEEELKRINKELEAYAHVVSHDLKGPISIIISSIGALNGLEKRCRGDIDADELKTLIEIINRSAINAAGLIDDLLSLAQAGQISDEISEVDVAEVVRRIFEERSGLIEEKSIKIVMGDDLGHITADPTHIYQLFSNLIVNALKYNDSPHPEVRIEYKGESEGYGLRYVVTDNGSGFSYVDSGSLFEPFYKGKGGGTGIGLAIVKRIIDIYGGDIRAYDNGGAHFEFTLRELARE